MSDYDAGYDVGHEDGYKSGVRETTRILHRPDRGTAGHRRRETGGDAQRAARQKALIEASMTPYAYDMRKWWSPVPAPRGGGRR